MLKCIHCQKIYKNATSFRKHYLICDILHNKDEEQMSLKDLITIVKQLVKDNKDKIKRIKYLESKLNNTKNINLIEYLNENINNIKSFNDFVQCIKLNKEEIKLILNNGFTNGIIKLFMKHISNCDEYELPLKAFNERNYLIKYDGKVWSKMQIEDFHMFIFDIQRKLMNYRDTMAEEDGDFGSDESLKIGEIIYGGVNRDNKIKMIYQSIYSRIKIKGRYFVNNQYKII